MKEAVPKAALEIGRIGDQREVSWYKSRQTVYSKPIRLFKDYLEVIFIISSTYFNVT